MSPKRRRSMEEKVGDVISRLRVDLEKLGVPIRWGEKGESRRGTGRFVRWQEY